jgi:hypothetical protein
VAGQLGPFVQSSDVGTHALFPEAESLSSLLELWRTASAQKAVSIVGQVGLSELHSGKLQEESSFRLVSSHLCAKSGPSRCRRSETISQRMLAAIFFRLRELEHPCEVKRPHTLWLALAGVIKITCSSRLRNQFLFQKLCTQSFNHFSLVTRQVAG